MRQRSLPLIAALALLTGCVAAEERTAHFEQKWPANGIGELNVEEVNGTVTVHGDSPDAITMVANVRARGVRPDPKQPYEGYMSADVDGNELAIRSRNVRHHGFFFGFGDEITINYDLHVPPQVALQLVTVNGKITTHGIAGEMNAKTVNGAMDIESTGTNEVSAKTVNGRIAAKFLQDFHGAKLGTVNGRVTCALPAGASFFGDFTQINGDFEAAFPLNIHSHPGSRRVSGEVNGGRYPLKISTVNGDITVENAPAAAPVPPPPPAPPAPRM
ncbi:MAG TPA: DUF4097 family beta strand repeat-containing protein [Thermoanaerobaculia bacterium]|nr:DUF4097 family beta strand repeat-containing protein [Thermoanaerobaculia bacterium]